MQLVLMKSGRVTRILGAIVDFRYSVLEDKITMTMVEDDAGPHKPVTEEFTIHAGQLTMSPRIPDARRVMTRVGDSIEGPDTLVGDWTYPHYTGSIAMMRFSRNGAAQLLVPFHAASGTWSAVGDRAVIYIGQEPGIEIHTQESDASVTDRRIGDKPYRRFVY